MNAVTEVMDELRKALAELEDCRARNADLRTMLEQVTRDRDHVEESLVRLETQRDEARALVDQLGSARDKAEAELRELQRSTSEALAQALEWQRERDEARADLREFVRQAEDAYALLKPLEEGSDVVERAVGHLLTVLRGRERPGPWAFDVVLRERDEARAEVERLREMAHDFEAMREDRDEARAERDAAIARITEVGVMVATNGNLLAKDAYRRGAEAMRKRCAMWVKHNSHEDGLGMGSQRIESALAAMPIPEEK